MRINEILLEMPAVWTRTPSNAYLLNGGKGQYGNMLKYGNTKAIYPDNADTFNTSQARDKVLAQVEQTLGNKIIWVNPTNKAGAGAFIIRSMENETGKEFYFGKYLKHTGNVQRHQHAKENDLTRWDANDFENVGYFNSQGNRAARLGKEHLVVAAKEAIKKNDWSIYAKALTGASSNSTGTKKTNQSYLPVDVLTTTENISSQAVLRQITAKYTQSNPDLVEATQAVVSGIPGPYASPTGIGRSQFSRDFCEILQPLSVISGAVEISSEPINFAGATITYNTSRSGGLYDSKIKLASGTEYLISSKKGGGTRSSVAGIQTALTDYVKKHPNIAKQYAKEISALNIISTSEIKPSPGNIGVLQVGIDLNILSAEDADIISKFDRASPREFHAAGKDNPIPKGTPKSVINLINQTPPSKSHGPCPYYQALNTVMQAVGDHFNNDPKMNELLNKVFASAGLIFISTSDNGKQFNFTRKSAIIELKLGESYLPFEAKKRLAFQVS